LARQRGRGSDEIYIRFSLHRYSPHSAKFGLPDGGGLYHVLRQLHLVRVARKPLDARQPLLERAELAGADRFDGQIIVVKAGGIFCP
jgi:hypothetical protein